MVSIQFNIKKNETVIANSHELVKQLRLNYSKQSVLTIYFYLFSKKSYLWNLSEGQSIEV